MTLTAQRLRHLLRYDQDTGIFRWRVKRSGIRAGSVAGGMDDDGYGRIQIDGKDYRTGRLAFLYMLGVWPNRQIDHRDGDNTNDRWSNLRPASHSQNNFNKPGRAKSGFKFIHRFTDGRASCWRVRLCVGGNTHMRSFPCIGQAIRYRNRLAQELHGQFARLNIAETTVAEKQVARLIERMPKEQRRALLASLWASADPQSPR